MNLETSFISPRPQRILMTTDTVGGVWTYTMELARALKPHGIEIVLASMGAPVSLEQRRDLALAGNAQLEESRFKLEWMANPWDDVAAAADWLLELEQRFRPDLVHLNGYAHGALPWTAPRIVVGHSCVLSWWQAVRGNLAPREWDRYRAAVAGGLRGAQEVVAPTQAMLQALNEHYGPLPHARVIPNGRRLPEHRPRPKEKIALTAGRLWDPAKNLAALNAIAAELPWPVYAAGEGKIPGDGQPVEEQLRRLGRLSSGELAEWYERASIYALPACYEPFGLSVLEAAQAGCALVLGDIPSLREVWDEAALFVTPQDRAALCVALKELMSSPARLAELGSKACRAATHYTPERMAAAYLLVYEQALRNAQPTTMPKALVS